MHMQNTQSIREIAIKRISEFLDETQIPAWQLGIRAVGNNKIWKHLTSGAEIKLGTLEKIEAFMAAERAQIAETVSAETKTFPQAETETAEEYLEDIGEAA